MAMRRAAHALLRSPHTSAWFQTRNGRGLATGIYDHTPGPIGFAFDIDGVLMLGGKPIPAAHRALALLHDAGGAPRYPITFLTNSGGFVEEERATRLSDSLGVTVSAEQVIQCHTPLKALAPSLPNRPVLLLGRGDLHRVAAGYGLHDCYTVADLAADDTRAVPFVRDAYAPGSTAAAAARPPPTAPFGAIVMLNDPADWYASLQLCLDVVLGAGMPGRRVSGVVLEGSPDTGDDENPAPVRIVFSNPDVEFANAYPTPRLGGGAFATCLQALHKEVTGRALPHVTWFGKPNAAPYELAMASLRRQAAELGWGANRDFGSVFAVGDNPAADVAGANAAGAPWSSVLVRTGVWRGQGNCRQHPAAMVVDDVEAAVRAALHRSRSATWHSLR